MQILAPKGGKKADADKRKKMWMKILLY